MTKKKKTMTFGDTFDDAPDPGVDETSEESAPSQDPADDAIVPDEAAKPAPEEADGTPGVGGQFISLGGGRLKKVTPAS